MYVKLITPKGSLVINTSEVITAELVDNCIGFTFKSDSMNSVVYTYASTEDAKKAFEAHIKFYNRDC